MNKHLIGFYRKDSTIESIYHSQTTFFDINLARRYKAVIIPLAPYTNQYPWTLSDYSNYLDPTTKSLLAKNIFWVTASKPSSPFYVLMYTDFKIRTMTRTGYLMIKHQDNFLPVKVSIEGREFLIECKGIGSPVGGFPATHSRNQAGCFNKAHIRITGGLSKSEGETEYLSLIQKNKQFQQLGLSSEVKPLGFIHYNLLNFDFSLLLRLVPSSLRASFTQHPQFDQLLQNTSTTAYYCMGQQVAALLKNTPPLFHQNLSLNNMVYVNQHQFDLTDWSETSHFFNHYSAFDYIRNLFPIVFLNKTLSTHHNSHYVKGLSNVLNTPFGSPKTIKDYVTINQTLLSTLGLDFYRYYKTNPPTYAAVIDNISCYKEAFSDVYYQSTTTQWVTNTLKPSLIQRKKVLTYLLECRNRLPRHIAKSLLAFKQTPDTKPYLTKVYQLYPPLKPLKSSNKKAKSPTTDLQTSNIGKFLSSSPILNEYFSMLSTKKSHVAVIKQLDTIITQVDQFLLDPTSLPTTQLDFLTLKVSASVFDTLYLIYPYYFFLMSYASTHQAFLQGAFKQATDSTEQAAIKHLLDHFESIITKLAANPEVFRSDFITGKSAICKLLILTE